MREQKHMNEVATEVEMEAQQPEVHLPRLMELPPLNIQYASNRE